MLEGNKLKKLLLKIELIKEEYRNNNKYTLLESSLMDDAIKDALTKDKKKAYTIVKLYFDTLISAQGNLNIPYELGETLDKVLNDKNVDVLIHRTNLFLNEDYSSEALSSIMRDGLANYGHVSVLGGGTVNTDYPSLRLITTEMTGLSGYVNLLGSWHNNDSIIILKVPKGSFEEMDNPEEIYNYTDGKYYIKPEYIVGNIARNKEGLINFKSREEILEMSHKR